MSTRALLAEVGWVSIEWRLKAAKVRLWDRAKLKVAGRDTNHLVTERMKQVREGETKGLSAEAKLILEEMGRGEEWSEGRRKAVREWGRQTDVESWRTWKNSQKDIYKMTKWAFGRERYLMWGTRKQVAMKFLFRLGQANLRANQHLGEGAICRMCDQGQRETEEHVLITCTRYGAQRARALSRLHDIWGHERSQRWKGITELGKAAEWLSSGEGGRGAERETDGTLKDFLTEVEGVRAAGAGEMSQATKG